MNKKITIQDIANIAGVSKTTVSFYLNGKSEKMSKETKIKIEDAIAKTGYRPSFAARSLNDSSNKIIGVIIGDVTNSFANLIVKGIMHEARLHDYDVIVSGSGFVLSREKLLALNMISMGVDGLIVQPTAGFETIWEEISNFGKPIVYFDSPNYDNDGLWVKTNNYEAVYETIEKMVEQGYEEFVIVTPNPYILRTRQERYKGFSDCLKKYGKDYHMLSLNDDCKAETVKKELLPYLEKENVCIFVTNNWLLPMVHKALSDYKDRIPESIGLLGFDSLEWSQLVNPSITTIVQPAYEEGMKAFDIMYDVINKRNIEEPRQVLKCHINSLESTNRKKVK